MQLEFRIPIEHADSFRAGLLRFLERNAGEADDAFTISHAEPVGCVVREQVYFENRDLGMAFSAYWNSVRP